jgi:hypothetical protein
MKTSQIRTFFCRLYTVVEILLSSVKDIVMFVLWLALFPIKSVVNHLIKPTDLTWVNRRIKSLSKEVNELQIDRIENKGWKTNNEDYEHISSKLLKIDSGLTSRMDGLANINKSIRTDLRKINTFTIHGDSFAEPEIVSVHQRLKNLEEYHKPSGIEMYGEYHSEVMLNRVKDLEKDITTWMNVTVDNQRDINELQLSLESMKRKSNKVLKDEPKIIFHPVPTQLEQDMIDSEAKGELIVKELRDEGYDWSSERKLKDKQVQDRMRADEAEYDRQSEPVNLDD